MAHKLADELISAILSLALEVDDELFADTDHVSPFSRATYSSADVLHVCKRWMRIGTPFLYSTVVIRSFPQAKALAVTLKRNPRFGPYIKKLRIEGAYSGHLTQVALVASNITDFCFTLAVWADQNPSGLLKLLFAIDPVRVILTTAPSDKISNKHLASVLSSFTGAVRRWKNLQSLYLFRPDFINGSEKISLLIWNWEDVSSGSLVQALASSTTLRSIHVYDCRGLTEPATITLASSPQAIIYLHLSSLGSSNIPAISRLPSHLRNKFEIVHSNPKRTARPAVEPSSNPSFCPMSHADHNTRFTIWFRIVEFAVEQPHQAFPKYRSEWFDESYCNSAVAASTLRVSREFFRVTVSVLWRHLLLFRVQEILCVQTYMERFNLRISDVHSLTLMTRSHGHEFCRTLIASATKLVCCSIPFDSDALTALGTAAGGTLLELRLNSPSAELNKGASFPGSLFLPFTSITHLRWYLVPGDVVPLPMAPTTEALPCLREINVWSDDESVLSLLAPFSLPSLQRLKIDSIRSSPTLKICMDRHSHKIKYLGALIDVDVIGGHQYPILEELLLTNKNSTPKATFAQSWVKGLPALQQIRLWGHGYLPESLAFDFLTSLKRVNFPALEKVEVARYSELWPTTEREIKKSHWPRIAKQMKNEGIMLTDGRGRTWRPRLNTRGEYY